MKAVDEALGALLSRERRHLIPTYQRDYEWTEEGQWQLLMDDVVDVSTRLLEHRAWAVERGEAPESGDARVGPHFMGAVVFEALPQHGAAIASCAVIDGQQRLTTVNLLLRGLLDALTAEGLTARARQVRKLILILDDTIADDEQHKLWPRRHDRDAWRAVMADTAPTDAHRYSQARRYFADRVTAVVEGQTPQRRAEVLDALVDAIVQKVKIVVVDLEPSDDAQLIFEVLNGRQTPLSAADLVKNLLFMRADTPEADLDTLYQTYWSPFDDPWWAGSVGRGHAARGRRDQLLATWLTVETGDEVNLGHLYGEARRHLSSSSQKLPDLLGSIHTLAREYRQIYERPTDVDPAIATVYHRMERLGVTTLVPLLAWLRTLPPERLTPAEHQAAVTALDSFVMRRLITGGQTRGYGRAFLIVLQQAQNADPTTSIPDAIRTALLSSPYALEWPDDQAVQTELLYRTFYGRISQERIRMILGPIDAHYQATRDKGEQATFDYDKLTIEHVMPREWRPKWKVTSPDPAAKAVAEQDRERHIHRMGNLTLVTKALNPALSNAAWDRKRPALAKHSKLLLNADIVTQDTWDETTISERAKDLSAAASTIWPRPN